MKSTNKMIISVFSMDFFLNVISWYIYLYLLYSVYLISVNMIYFSLFYILRLIISTSISFILSYVADVKGVNKVMKLTLLFYFIMTIILFYYSKLTLFLIYVYLIIFETLFTLYGILKYSLVPKISNDLEKINSAYELSYSILMVVGPLLALVLLRAKIITLLIGLIPLFIFILFVNKFFTHTIESRNLSLISAIISAIRNIFKKDLIRIIVLYVSLTVVGLIVNLSIVNISEYLKTNVGFIANFSLINVVIGAGSLISSIIIMKNRYFNFSLILLSWIILSFYPDIIFLLYYFNFYFILEYIFFIVSFFNGFSNSIISVFIVAKVQKISSEYTSTAFSILTFLSNILGVITLYITGMLYILIYFILVFSSIFLFANVIVIIKLSTNN